MGIFCLHFNDEEIKTKIPCFAQENTALTPIRL